MRQPPLIFNLRILLHSQRYNEIIFNRIFKPSERHVTSKVRVPFLCSCIGTVIFTS